MMGHAVSTPCSRVCSVLAGTLLKKMATLLRLNSVSLEPGGQLELSGAPLESVHQTCREVSTHMREVKEVADEMGAGFLSLGFRPDTKLEDVPVMPKARYSIMRAYMPKVGSMLPFAFEEGFGFEQYVDYALDVPMYFVYRGGKYLDASGKSFRDFLDGNLDVVPGEKPTISDFDDHLSTIFPEVRLKTFLEMRGCDTGPWGELCAMPAFWVGLLYDEAALDAAWDLVKDWTEEERHQLRQDVPKMGLQTPFRNKTLRDIALAALAISREGLKTRGRTNAHGENESVFLQELDGFARTGRSNADKLISDFTGKWDGDILQAYNDCRY